MRMISRTVIGLFLLSPLGVLAVLPAQNGIQPAAVVTASSEVVRWPAGSLVKEIDDSTTGDRWLLLRDATHPGGPGRLVRITRIGLLAGQDESKKIAAKVPAQAAVPVIRAGDALILEESTPLVEARLEARALAPAISGAEFNARLAIGGKVVRAVALGKGRAAFVAEAGIRP